MSGGLTAATAANSTTNGSGGNGVVRNDTYASGTKFVRADVGDGGDGGASYANGGSAGATATNSSNNGGTGTTQAGAAGGAAGDAVNGNSYITWVATGTRYGAIV